MESVKNDTSNGQTYIFIGFRVTPDEDAQLRRSVKESGVSISNYVRKALALSEEERKPGRKPKQSSKASV